MRTRAVSSSPRAHSILLTCRCASSVREARKPLRDNNHGQTASHLCQEFWTLPPSLPVILVPIGVANGLGPDTPHRVSQYSPALTHAAGELPLAQSPILSAPR